jgi:hypothetical protein
MHAVAIAEFVLTIGALYGVAGAAVAIAFAARGVTRVLDGSATPGARVLLLPAAVALWPLVLWRWRGAARRR